MAGQKENSCERRDKLLRAIQISFQLGNSLKEFAVALPARQLADSERRDKLLRAIQISFQLDLYQVYHPCINNIKSRENIK